MKKQLSLFLALVMALAMTGCGQTAAPAASAAEDPANPVSSVPETDPADSSATGAESLPEDGSVSAAPPAEEEPRETLTFGYSCPEAATPAQSAMAQELQRFVEGRGDTLVIAEAAAGPEEQCKQLEEFAQQGVDALFLCPTDASALESGLSALGEKEIPVFGFGGWEEPLPDGVISVAVSDEYNAGYVCGEDLAQRCPDGGNIVVLEQPELETVTQRVTGFLEAAEESGVPFEVVGQLDTQGDRNTAAEATEDALAAYPDVVAIFAGSDETALGALSALPEGSECVIYSADGSPALKALLGRSQIQGTGAQSPMTMAETLAECAYQYLDGEDVAASNTIPTFLITADNVEEFGTDGWQ